MVRHSFSDTRSHARGFTLVEMLAVMGIFVLITSVTLANHSRFGGNITLETLAYDVALSVRQAQIYGIAVRRFDLSGSDFSRSYGIHFSRSSPSSYQLFADFLPSPTADGRYTCTNPGDPAACELVLNNTLQGGYRVVDLCVRSTDQIETCGVDELNLTFMRPEPDAYIRTDAGQTYERARIVLGSPQGGTADILVELAGQISVR